MLFSPYIFILILQFTASVKFPKDMMFLYCLTCERDKQASVFIMLPLADVLCSHVPRLVPCADKGLREYFWRRLDSLCNPAPALSNAVALYPAVDIVGRLPVRSYGLVCSVNKAFYVNLSNNPAYWNSLPIVRNVLLHVKDLDHDCLHGCIVDVRGNISNTCLFAIPESLDGKEIMRRFVKFFRTPRGQQVVTIVAVDKKLARTTVIYSATQLTGADLERCYMSAALRNQSFMLPHGEGVDFWVNPRILFTEAQRNELLGSLITVPSVITMNRSIAENLPMYSRRRWALPDVLALDAPSEPTMSAFASVFGPAPADNTVDREVAEQDETSSDDKESLLYASVDKIYEGLLIQPDTVDFPTPYSLSDDDEPPKLVPHVSRFPLGKWVNSEFDEIPAAESSFVVPPFAGEAPPPPVDDDFLNDSWNVEHALGRLEQMMQRAGVLPKPLVESDLEAGFDLDEPLVAAATKKPRRVRSHRRRRHFKRPAADDEKPRDF